MGLLKITFEALVKRPASCSAYALPAILNAVRQLSTSNTAGRYVSEFSPPPRTNELPDPKTVFQLNFCKFQSSLQSGAEVLFRETSKFHRRQEHETNYCWTRYHFIFTGEKKTDVLGDIENDLKFLCRQPDADFWSFEVLLKFLKHNHAILPYHIWDKFEALELKFRTLDREESHLITDELYSDFYKRSSILLLEIKKPLKDIIKFEPCFVKPVNASIKGENPDVKELKKSGDEALERKKFEEAVKFYTNALITCGDLKSSCVSNDKLVQLYSQRSVAYGELGDISSAEKDTDCANYFSNLDFKVYANHEEAVDGVRKLLYHDFELDTYFRFDYFEKGIFSNRHCFTY